MFYVQTSTLPPPSMHQKPTEHGTSCKQINQFLTKSHAELEDNSNIVFILYDDCTVVLV
jgi:hypothetical protein